MGEGYVHNYSFNCRCGTGWPIKKTDGFIMKGTEAFSPVFKLFQIKKKSKLNISCNFFVCKDSCDGVSLSYIQKKISLQSY